MKPRDERNDEIRAELEFHLETEQEEQQAAGMAPTPAHYAARRELGNITLLTEAVREVWRLNHVNVLLRDMRYAMRTMRKDWGFTLAAVLCLTLGIGANTAVFSSVNAYLLRSLPYPNPGRLVAIYESRPREGAERNWVSYADFLDWRDQNRTFSAVGAYEPMTFNYTGSAEPERITGAVVTANFFDVLGVRPWRGRNFLPQDETPGAVGLVVTHGFWQRHFGPNDLAVGGTITIDGRQQPILGILPPGFVPPVRGWDIFSTIKFDAQSRSNRGNHSLIAFARIEPGATLDQSRRDMDLISKRLEHENPAINKGHYANVVPLLDALRGDLRPAMLLLLAAAGLVLLIACFNVANLLLARSVTRSREIALRLALGGSRLLLVRQLLTESLMLSLSGAALGIAGAFAGMRYMRSILPVHPNIGPEDLKVDLPVLAFTATVALLAGVLFGLAPAFVATSGSLVDWLRSGGRQQSASAGHQRHRWGIVTGQTAFAVLLLIGAGLLLRSFWKLQAVDPGFRPEKLLTLQLALPGAYREDARKIAFQHEFLERARALPGVSSAGFTSFLPFADQNSRMGLTVEGIAADPNEPRRANWRLITPGYIETMKIRLLAGRRLEESDKDGAPIVMLVNETAARRYWQGRDPVGSHARLATMKNWATVVGVVGDVKHWGLEEGSRPEAYLSAFQAPIGMMSLVVRTQSEPEALIGAVREQLRSIDKSIPAVATHTMEDLISTSTSARRFLTQLVTAFAALALLLAAGGTFAQLAYTVSQRSQEIGIRMALGASRMGVVGLMMRKSLAPVVCGGLIGVAATFGLARLLQKMLFGVEALDVLTLVTAPLLMIVIAAIACYLPSWRAAQTQPARALRSE